jgi:hypothetical protein
MPRQLAGVAITWAGKTADITIEADTFQITAEPGIVITAARTISGAILRQKLPTMMRPP